MLAVETGSATLFHSAHTRARTRQDRDREYEEFLERESAADATEVPPHLGRPGGGTSGQEYRDRGQDYREHMFDRTLDRMPQREHRAASDDEYPPHRTSSRRAVNAI